MFSKRTDLPLDQDTLSRYLPWLIAFMVYLAVLALAGLLVLGALARYWDSDVSGTMTVQIPPTGSAEGDDKRVRAAVDLLLGEPAIIDAEAITEERLMALLEPWLGTGEMSAHLPLPRLIDVEIESGTEFDMAGLSRRLEVVVPGATLDDHRIWLDRLVRLVRSVEALASLLSAPWASACAAASSAWPLPCPPCSPSDPWRRAWKPASCPPSPWRRPIGWPSSACLCWRPLSPC